MDLPKEDFYPSDKYRCKECHKAANRRNHYEKTRHLYGIIINEKGQWINYQGRKKTIYWTGNMLSDLKRYFPTTKNAELAEMIGVSQRTLIRKARELGISKDEQWQKEQSRKNGFFGYLGCKNRHGNSSVNM